MFKHALKLFVTVVLCATAFSCASDDTGSGGTGAGAFGGVGGAAGTVSGGMGGAAGMVSGGAGGAGGLGGAGGAAGGGTGGAAGGMGGTGGMPDTGLPTWTAVHAEVILKSGCNGGAQCHGGSGGMLNMTTSDGAYDALVGVNAMGISLPPSCHESMLKRVVPMMPDQSLLVQKLEGTQPCGMSMPPGAMLAPAKIQQVRTWIMNGALKD